MAESIVKIKLAVDTASTAKLEDTIRSLSAQEKKANEASSFYRENQKAALVRLKDVASGLSTILKKQEEQFTAVGNSIASLKLKEVFNAQILKDFNASLSSTIAEFSRLSNIISTAPAAAGTISRTPLTDLSQVSTENLRAYYQNLEKLDREANAEKIRTAKEYNDFVAQYEKARVERITSETKRMYAAMFDEIAAKEVAAQERAARINAARKTADSRGYTPFALGTVGQVREAEQAKIDAARKTADSRGYTPFAAGTVGENKALKDQEKASILAAKQEAAMQKLTTIQKEYAKDQAEILKNQDSWQKSQSKINSITASGKDNLKPLKKDVTDIVEQHEHWLARLTKFVVGYRLVNSAINLVKNTLADIPRIGMEQQAAETGLAAIFGSTQARANLYEIQDIAKKSGQSLIDLQQSYTKFATSAVLAGASQEQVNTVFRQFSESATVLRLGADKVNSVFLALDQMYGKGKVQSEELKKQLGNALPAAVEIGARAWANYANNGIVNVGKFMKAMKKNQVDAIKFVPEFAKVYREILGDKAFELASRNLTASINRFKNEYTLILADVFNDVQGVISSTVAFGVDGLESLRKNLEGVGQTIAALGLTLLVSEIAAAVKSLVVGIKALEGTLIAGRLATFGTALLTSWGGIAAAITYSIARVAESLGVFETRYGKITDLSEEAINSLRETAKGQGEAAQAAKNRLKELEEASSGFYVLYKNQQIEMSSYAKVFWNDISEVAILSFKTIAEGFSELLQSLQISSNDWGRQFGEFLGDIVGRIAETYITVQDIIFPQQDMKIREMSDSLKKGAATYQEAVKQFGDKFALEGKISDSFKEYISKLSDRALQIQKEKNDAVEKVRQAAYVAPKSLGAGVEVGGTEGTKTPKSEITQAYRTDLEKTKAAFEQFKTDMADTMGVLNELYAEGQLSIKEYYERRISLMNSDKDIQRQMLEAEKAVASARGDSAKVAKLEGEILKLNTEAAKENSKARVEQTKDLEKYSKALEEIRAAELLSQGVGSEGAVAKFRTQYAGVYKEAIEGQKTEDLALLKRRELTVGLEENLKNLNEEKQLAQQKYNLELDKVNTKVSAGIMGQFQAMSELTKANEDYLKVKEAEYAKMLQFIREVEAGKGKVPAKDRLEAEQMSNEIEKMKLNANEFANYFQKTVGDGFANAFTEFARGTKTAKEAFRDMAASIAQDLAKMAAQEAASSLMSGVLKPLFGSAISGLGSFFGGGFSGNGPLLSYANPFANGGVASGLSSVSGSMLTSATYFPNARVTPLASGGVVAGEAGAEAVLPLKRNKSGKLGVVLENSGQSDANVYNISVNVQSSANDTPAGTGEKIAVSIMRTIAREEISSANRSGNFKAARSM